MTNLRTRIATTFLAVPFRATGLVAQDGKLGPLKKEALTEVDKMQVFTQQMVDMIFRFGELGFQKFETSR